ncbi:hypothetical protein M011DRAFT_476786 [Sporormia fimetaria CBS 119925]|uniref:Ecp2 effector protein domain-containing protein n=1 Tax=Sporormia fimetaria CBS 119925 TaxID=1340428 RepID=A0A6A6VC20_9PLEO|nr:hypothetical protein M011DRAFT_476786 [Sporormia fimetaria CBS 119925]
MHFSKLLALFSLSTAIQAFTIPPGTSDGVYAVKLLDDGTYEHIKLAEPSLGKRDPLALQISPQPESSLERRGRGQLWCGCGNNMNHGDCDAAVDDLKNQLRGGGCCGGFLNYYSIRGSVVAFACNRNGDNVSRGDGDFSWAIGEITNRCGWYVAGSFDAGDWDYQMIMGYMIYHPGLDFCGMSTSSPHGSC